MTTLTDAELIDRVARAWADIDGRSYVFRDDPEGPQSIFSAEGYRSDAKELLTRAGIITPAGRAEIERREEGA